MELNRSARTVAIPTAGIAALVAAALTVAALAGTLLAGATPALARLPRARHSFRVQPVCARHRRHHHGANCLALRLVPAAEAGSGEAAAAKAARGESEPEPSALTPQQLHAAYSLPDQTSSSAGKTIAVIDAYDDPTAEADLGVYDRHFGLPECTKANGCFQKVNEEGAESPLPAAEGYWAAEMSIDVQMAHAICQSCHVMLVEASSEEFSDLSTAVEAAVKAGATAISNSYGSYGLESEVATEERTLDSRYDHPGTVITASAGDCGYRDQNNPEGALQCVGAQSNVEWPAASPYVVAVGGTTLSASQGSWESSVWGNGGGGCSSLFTAQPWQSSLADWSATGCGSNRLSTDVSAIASPATGVAVYDGTPETGKRVPGWQTYGGTSVASPIIAAEFALSGGARGVEYPAQTLYRHLGEASSLYDLVSGANGTCGNISCEAAAGYDGPSGVGSPLGLHAFAPSSGTPASVSAPSISGVAEVAHKLTAVPGSWSPAPATLDLQWLSCSSEDGCEPIEGANEATYTVTSAVAGTSIRVAENASDSSGFGPPAVSAATATVPGVAPPPQIKKITPKAGAEGAHIVITGSYLDATQEVRFGSTKANFTASSEETLNVEVPPGSGTVYITLTTPSGTTEATKKTRFKYKKPRK